MQQICIIQIFVKLYCVIEKVINIKSNKQLTFHLFVNSEICWIHSDDSEITWKCLSTLVRLISQSISVRTTFSKSSWWKKNRYCISVLNICYYNLLKQLRFLWVKDTQVKNFRFFRKLKFEMNWKTIIPFHNHRSKLRRNKNNQ